MKPLSILRSGAVTTAIKQLEKMRAQAKEGGGKGRIKKQHDKGKLTARERLEILLDKGSFNELDMFVRHRSHDFSMEKTRFLSDGVITGYGAIDGRKVVVFSHDFTIFGGCLSESFAEIGIKGTSPPYSSNITSSVTNAFLMLS